MQKKAQVKFGESIGVILIVYLIIMGGLMWYNKINNNNLYEIYKDDQQDRAFEKYYYISNLDLIHESKKGVIQDYYDLNSMIVFSNFSIKEENKIFFSKQLATSLITLKIYDNNENLKKDISFHNLTIYNNTPEENDILDSLQFKTIIPIKYEKTSKIGILSTNVFITKQ